MSRELDAAVTKWAEHTGKWHIDLGRIEDVGRIRFTPTRIEFTNGITIAQAIRVNVEGKPTLVRMVLPNALTARAYHQVNRALKTAGVETISVPGNVLERTEANLSSIVVIDTQKGRGLRADTHLFRADVRFTMYDRRSWKRIVHVRQSYFLSGYDVNEPGLSYFFCELPQGAEPESIAQAYQALRPDSVVRADRAGVKVKRQGDMFFIRMKKGYSPDGSWTKYARSFLHNSNHMATEVMRSEGLTYVRGKVIHAPSGRRPDHHRLNLGRRYWWLCVGNTVPVVG